MEHLKSAVDAVVKEVFNVETTVDFTRPDEQFGDYATNAALQLAKPLGKNSREIAETLAEHLRTRLEGKVSDITIAGPGFINIKLADHTLWHAARHTPTAIYQGQKIVAEYSDPNPFKVLHAGHVYTTVVGDAIAQLMEAAGGEVHRVNYGGDVGLHVGRTMWAILQALGGEHPEKLNAIPEQERPSWLSARYVLGNEAYESDESAKTAIIELNKRVYQLHAAGDRATAFAQIYWTCREWSYAAFDHFYERLGTRLEKYYPESEVAEVGLQKVREHVGTVFAESEGAVVFHGEQYGLHTRVFINREGLPTYEAKEVGLILKKHEDYGFDRSVVVTGNEQQDYMAVVLKAIELFLPDLARVTTYVPHGMVKLVGGIKMSSRKGNIVPAEEVLSATAAANRQLHGKDDEEAVLAAVKYAFLRQRIGGDVLYDPEASVSLEGNSGPYLQYAHARARSILAKAGAAAQETGRTALQPAERSLLRKITEYAEVIDKAATELMPHYICTYLYELAQQFNSFYEHNRVIGDDRQAVRLQLIGAYADVLKKGLGLLNIPAPDKM